MTHWQPDGCWLCGRLLTGRAEKWCSTKCSELFWANHSWTWAKAAAKKACYLGKSMHTCARCGEPTGSPEVNHKTPCLGAHNTNGCWHHLSGLEVLDHQCHLVVTAEQRAAGMFDRG
jgi:hypothetical protein